jgi:hypothetical protein
MTKDELKRLEQHLREHPMVALRLRHKRDMFAADAAVKNCIYGESFPVDTWEKSSTAQQVRIAYAQLTKNQQG